MRRISRWRAWLAIAAICLASWSQAGVAFASSKPTPSLGVSLHDLVKWLAAPDGSGDTSKTGTAADVRRARSAAGHPAGNGSSPGKGKGQLGAFSAIGNKIPAGTSGAARRGFDARTSKRVASKSGAQFDYYQNADGSFTRKISQNRINYQDSSGNWQTINTALAKGTDGRYHEKANSFGVSLAATTGAASGVKKASATSTGSVLSAVATTLPWRMANAAPADSVVTGSSGSGELATLSLSSSQSVSWSLSGANDVAASVSGSTAEYDGILADTNLILTPTDSGVKESLVLQSTSAPTTWVFPMQLTGLTLTTASDGSVELVDSSGTVQATLPQAYAYDSYVNTTTGERHENWAMTYSVTTVNGTPAVQMSLDSSWLSGSSIQFPVTVDPTMTVSIAGQTETTYVRYPDTIDYSSSTVLKVGTPDSGASIDQAFLKYPSLPTSNGYHITAASFAAFDNWAYTCGSSTSYSVYPITSSWSVTGAKSWSGRPSTAAAIGTWSGTVSSTVCGNTSGSTSTGQWQYTTLSTSYFQDIALGTTANNGISLFSSGTDNNQWKIFDSSQVSDHSPYLSLTYAPDVAPQIRQAWPQAGYTTPTLTPEVQAQAVDPDNWPNSSVQYDFAVYNSSQTGLFSTGWSSSGDWTIPSGKLAWGTSYYWAVQVTDGWTSTWSPYYAFTT